MMFDYNHIFGLPERLLLGQKITKVFFQDNYDLSTKEKTFLSNEVLRMEILGRISPSTSNIPLVKNEQFVYEEVFVMQSTLRTLEGNQQQIIELFQKYIPYQIVLIAEDEHDFIINTCEKRVNLNDKNKRTIEGYFTTPTLSKLYKNEVTISFFSALDYKQLDKTNLETLYKSYNRAVVQYQTASLTGSYNVRTQKRTEDDMQLLLHIEEIEKDITSLSNQLKKSSQLSDKVNLNVSIQNKRKEIENIKHKLKN